jgi:hypothetical protein
MPPETQLAYLLVHSDEARSAYVGGVMVTDAYGLPLEFRYTQPIRPTRLQKVLYGGAMDGFIRRDVIGARLLKDLEHKPTALIVREEPLVMLGLTSAFPVVQVFQTNLDPLGDPGAQREVDASSLLVQLTDTAGPVRVAVAKEDKTLLSAARDVLLNASATMDACEPLERVQEAILLLCEEAASSSTS